MLRNRSRFTIHQTLNDINHLKSHISKAYDTEERARDQVDDDLYDMSDRDDWGDFTRHKAMRYFKDDHVYYQQCVSKRMKLEKEMILLYVRLNKLYNVRKLSLVNKTLLINDVLLQVDQDCSNYIKHLMNQYFNPLYQYNDLI